MILYHGSQNDVVEPCFGKGEDHHDFGRVFHAAYEARDGAARNKMRTLIADPEFNRLERLFADVLREARP